MKVWLTFCEMRAWTTWLAMSSRHLSKRTRCCSCWADMAALSDCNLATSFLDSASSASCCCKRSLSTWLSASRADIRDWASVNRCYGHPNRNEKMNQGREHRIHFKVSGISIYVKSRWLYDIFNWKKKLNDFSLFCFTGKFHVERSPRRRQSHKNESIKENVSETFIKI